MSNGAQAAKGNVARATASSAARNAVTPRPSTHYDGGRTELQVDDPMDADGVLEASQISQTQIIERQAETIARLERHAARDKEYRTVTKVKLKEAAARLKEYRLRVEALLVDVDAAKAEIAKLEGDKKKALAQVQAAKQKAAVVAPPPEPKKPEMNTVAVQTPWKKAFRTASTQTAGVPTRDTGTQAETDTTRAATAVRVAGAGVNVGKEKATDNGEMVLETESAVVNAIASGVSTATMTSGTSAFDAIGAAIDAELEFSDDEEDTEGNPTNQSAQLPKKVPVPAHGVSTLPLVLDDVISREIDKELELSSSSSDESSDDESEDEVKESTRIEQEDRLTGNEGVADTNIDMPISSRKDEINVSCKEPVDPIAAAIDAELASDSGDDAEGSVNGTTQPGALNLFVTSGDVPNDLVGCQVSDTSLPLAMPLSLDAGTSAKPEGEVDLVSAAIDAELASSSEEENEEGQTQSREALRISTMNMTGAPKTSIRQEVELDELRHSINSNFEASEISALASPTINTVSKGDDIMVQLNAGPTIQEKSRTLSLSSDSSSSSDFDDESAQSVSTISRQELIQPTVEGKVSIVMKGNGGVIEPATMQVIPLNSTTKHNTADPEPSTESKKRKESVNATKTTAEGEPELKKRKNMPSEERSVALASAPTSPISKHSLEPALSSRKHEDMPRPQVVDPLAPRDVAAFKIAIALQVGEEPDTAYVTRTLGVLVKHTAALLRIRNGTRESNVRIASNPHVHRLCTVLLKEHSQRHIGHDALLEGMVRILRTPRSRHVLERSIVQLSSLFQLLLFLRLGVYDSSNQFGADDLRTDMTPELYQVLLSIRDLVVTARLKDGFVLPETEGLDAGTTSIVVSTFRPAITVSYDKAFLGHAAAFYTTICRALNRFDLPLVLIVDVLKCHPNIKGLYCTNAITQVDPRVLRKHWDSRGREQTSAMRAVIIHILQVITYQSRDKQEMVYKESATMLLSSIAEWVEDPLLMSAGPTGDELVMQDYVDGFVGVLWRDHVVCCIEDSHSNSFDTEKALELLTTFHGAAAVSQHFPIKRFLTVQSSETFGAVSFRDARIAKLIGAIAHGTARSNARGHDSHEQRAADDKYIDEAIRWMLNTCRREKDDNASALSEVVGALADLLVGLSTHESWHKRRDEYLRELLQILSSHHLRRLNTTSLRVLRLLVTSACPFITK